MIILCRIPRNWTGGKESVSSEAKWPLSNSVDLNCYGMTIRIGNHYCFFNNHNMHSIPLMAPVYPHNNKVNPFHRQRNWGLRHEVTPWSSQVCWVAKPGFDSAQYCALNHHSKLPLQTRHWSSPPMLEIRITWGHFKNTDKSNNSLEMS